MLNSAVRLTRDSQLALETREALMRPQSYDARSNTIQAVVATSSPVARRDTRGAYSEVLDVNGAELDTLRGAHVLNSHRQDDVTAILGTVVDAVIEGDQIVASILLSGRSDVAAIIDDIRSGVIANVSIGYEVSEWKDGTDTNGKRTRTAVKWRPREISFVPVPADPRARTRSLDLNTRATENRAIRELGRRSGVTQAIIDEQIDGGASLDQAGAVFMQEMLSRSPMLRSAHNLQTLDNPEVFQRAAGEALYVRVAPNHRPAEAARQFIGLTIPDIARNVLQRNGVNTVGMGTDTLITRALHTTSDFSLILADTVGRSMRAAYQSAPSGIRQLARETTAADFRKKSRLQLDASGFTLEKVNESGEFKSGTMAEAAEGYAIDSYGKIFGISRKALVNDDIGAFTDLSRRVGQAASAFEAQFLVNLLISNSGNGPTMSDSVALFDNAGHKNKASSGAAPAELTLSAARLAMRKQTGQGGGLITVTPRFVLVPADLETSTEKLLTAIQATATDDANPFSRLVPVVEPRLTSATRWYVVADPAEIDGLEFAYLAGAPGPQIESRAGFEVDGVQIKVRLDFGGGFVDWRGWYMNAGA